MDLFTAPHSGHSGCQYKCNSYLKSYLVPADDTIHAYLHTYVGCCLYIRVSASAESAHLTCPFSDQLIHKAANWPSGKASVSGAGDRRFESCIGRYLFAFRYYLFIFAGG